MKNARKATEGRNRGEDRDKMSRREFAIRLAAGASIAGFVLMTGKRMAGRSIAAAPAGIPATPELSDQVVFGAYEGMVSLRRKNSPHSPLCVVNETGMKVIRLLDGRHTVPEISRRVAAALRMAPDESLAARIAFFIVQVSQLGFLKKPFYATIYENRIS